ncbi:GDSL esterase/lipase [Rhynchospora pubera]|uniref:GDSL esterase/lipase n=1 Tax=Rhynchospora pubera TaxID=906938 RepID=A0AAV8C4R1_9POAL|nr:GDSL esterase/lipase [Rhynchospora pubera]
MATSPLASLIPLALLFLPSLASGCYTRLFAFGDSLTDTGNFHHSIGDQFDPVARLPYGQTYFGRPTGRFSDGRVIVDFVAKAFGLPFTLPYLVGRTADDFKYGANFAVGGATALNNDYFRKRDVEPNWTEHSLDEQIRWFKQLLNMLATQSERDELMRNSLFFVGEIGGNDYNHLFIRSKTLDEVRAIVPDVADAIGAAVKELIQLGAKTLVIPGNFPIGCVPLYLRVYQSDKEEDYHPKTRCINWLNEFAEYHNRMIINKINSLKESYPNVTIIYADYYGASMNIFRDPVQFGFEVPLNACCGSDAPYNCTPSILCGSPGSSVCKDPSTYASWDGLHLTEASYKLVAEGILEGPYASPPLTKSCTNLQCDSDTLKLPFSDPFSSI